MLGHFGHGQINTAKCARQNTLFFFPIARVRESESITVQILIVNPGQKSANHGEERKDGEREPGGAIL
jgi:hypothetical protein